MSSTLDFFKTMDFDPTVDIGPTSPPQLELLVSSNPSLKIYTRASPHFASLKSIWNLKYATNEPLALIRPINILEVTTVIKFCVVNNLPLAVRSGGHDLFGRSIIPDAVILDIRELNSITLAEDQKTVVIGGGVQSGDLVNFLDEKGLVTPSSLARIVGWAGWAFGGGFGPLINAYGLGVDQLVSARVATADGEVQEADPELLWGIKGAGGAFGVVTDLTVKVYPLTRMLGGMILFHFDQAGKVIKAVQDMFDVETIPKELCIGVHFSKRGGSLMLSMAFSWVSEDLDEGRKWLERIKSLGNVMKDMVSETTLKKWSDSMGPMLPPPSYSHSRSFFLSEMTAAAVKILSSAAERIPDGVQFGIGNFFVRGEAIKSHADSSYRLREPYVFVHALAPVLDPSMAEEAKQWPEVIFTELEQEGLVKANYVAILDEGLSVEECFGKENFRRLKALKKKVDPENFFRFTAAQLI
ncbi:FAD binding domain-containing protein [Leptodontidium sp. 2 PMI_412]|nr:FAD binding domain-containing protein [Leptodontidium sp. 2 PMI_412]